MNLEKRPESYYYTQKYSISSRKHDVKEKMNCIFEIRAKKYMEGSHQITSNILNFVCRHVLLIPHASTNACIENSIKYSIVSISKITNY